MKPQSNKGFACLETKKTLPPVCACVVCNTLAFESRVTTCCKVLLCKACQDFTSKCPRCPNVPAVSYQTTDKAVSDKINQLRVKCIYHSRGCDEWVRAFKLRRHSEKCKFKMAASRHIVGIDLGTTFSSIGVYRDGELVTIPNSFGEVLTPSALYFEKSSTKVHVGAEAIARGREDSAGLVIGTKRLMGETYKPNLIPPNWPYSVVAGPNQSAVIQTRGRKITPEKCASLILQELVSVAEKFLNDKVQRAVITVPAHFRDSQRRATIAAAELIGLEVEMLLNEPTAAAMCYYPETYKEDNSNGSQKYLVFDLGGGTLDITIVEILQYEAIVLGITGDSHLGGSDFDVKLADLLSAKIRVKHGNSVQLEKAQLLHVAEQAKIALSSAESTTVSLSTFGLEGFVVVTRSEFELVCELLFARCMTLVRDVLTATKLSVIDIENVILAGGSTHIPKVVRNLKDLFLGREPLNTQDPSLAIVIGATISAALRNPLYVSEDGKMLERMVISDVCAHTLGMAVTVEGKYDCVTPRGVLKGNTMVFPIINRFTLLPHIAVKEFPVIEKETAIIVFEGESENPANNTQLGYFTIKTETANPVIEVKFEYGDSGMLYVSASSPIDEGAAAITLTGKQSKVDLSNVKCVKDRVAVVAERPGVDATLNEDRCGITDMECFILDKIVHIEWTVDKALKKHIQKFTVDINGEVVSVPVHKVDKSKMTYLMPVPANIEKETSFSCKVQLTVKNDTLPWSSVVSAEYYPAHTLAARIRPKEVDTLRRYSTTLLFKVFGQDYGKNPQFWGTLALFSKLMSSIRAKAKAVKDRRKNKDL